MPNETPHRTPPPVAHAALRLAALLCLAIPAAHAQQAVWRPEKTVEFVVPAAPGASFDVTARTIHRIWQDRKMLEVASVVVNKPGGGGRIGQTYLNQHAGDAHYLSILTPGVLSNHILGQNKFNYTDFTPISVLFAEYLCFAVRPDSPLRSAKDMAEMLKKDPEALSTAVATSRGGALHTAAAIAMKAAGVDIKKMKIVVFNSNAESVTALLGGHVDIAVSPPYQLMPHVQSGKVRVIAISSPQRVKGAFAGAATWREQGINSSFASWRGVMGPKGLTATQVAYWEDILAKLSKSDEWKRDVERNLWEVNFVPSRGLTKYLEGQYDELKRILAELELAK
ncbi:MAG: tripartite tricarboxylate transporter substrate binding protein [Betaproteobacteria bacterium]|nr:tripartite tricarboxylate transporter substrate binding protein [Betaproteobacteria bacterium]